MELSKPHIDFESKCRSIIGHTLIGVEYLEIDYPDGDGEPFYKTKYPEIDSIDFSVVLHTDQGAIEIFWDDQFFQFGIGLKINEELTFSNYKTWLVTDNLPWIEVNGSQISAVKINWEEVTTTEEASGLSESYTYPQDVRIEFENEKAIFISAAGFLNLEDDNVYGMMDNLTITANEQLGRKVKMIN